MRKITRVLTGAVIAAAVIGGSHGSAGAAPNPNANCNGIYSYSDAQRGERDDVSHILKEIAVEQGVTPGAFHRFDRHGEC